MERRSSQSKTTLRRALIASFLLAGVALSVSAQQPSKSEPKVREARRVGAEPGFLFFVFAAVSPDGRFLSYPDWGTGDLGLHDLATGEKRRLTNQGYPEFAYQSTFSPDSTQIAYNWFHRFGQPDSFGELRVVKTAGGQPRVVYRNQAIWNIVPKAWSPDGKQILALLSRKERPGQLQLVLISVADGSVQVLKPSYASDDNEKIVFSPDGRYIAYDLPQDGSQRRDIFLLSIDGKREMPLVKHPANDLLLGWAPDGKRVLFASDRTGTLHAWVIQVAAGKPKGNPEPLPLEFGKGVLPLGFTQKGSYYYLRLSAKTDLYVATFDPATGKVQVPPTLVRQLSGYNISPDWSPDGRFLAYAWEWGGPFGDLHPSALWIRSVETGTERQIPLSIANHGVLRPRWSPDGRSFLLDGVNGGHGTHRIDVETGEITTIRTVADGDDQGWSNWSSDGKAVCYRHGLRILVRDLQTSHEKELYRGAPAARIAHLAVSRDGQRLAFVSFDRETGITTLKVIPTTGGEARELFGVQRPEALAALDWTPDGRQLLFGREISEGEKQKFELWRISAEGGEPQPVGLAMEGVNLYGLRIHPEGNRFAFTTGRHGVYSGSELWVVENFLPAIKSAK